MSDVLQRLVLFNTEHARLLLKIVKQQFKITQTL